jgi:putative oxidoreductase
MSYGILLLRVVVGGTIFAHGAQKLFGWFGGPGLRGTASFFGSSGWRLPLITAFLAGVGEASGLAFALGFLTPLAALGIAIVMLNAIFAVHWKNGFFNGAGGLEFPLTIATVAVAVAATGPERFSIDNLIGWADDISGLWWGVGVAAAALAITAVNFAVLRERHRMQGAPAA